MKNLLKRTTLLQVLLLISVITLSVIACKKTSVTSSEVAPQTAKPGDLLLNNEHEISNETATLLINRFKSQYPTLRSAGYYKASDFKKVLSQPNLSRIKFYFGNNVNNQPEIYLLGINNQGNDMITGSIIASAFPNNTLQVSNLLSLPEGLQNVTLAIAAVATRSHRVNYPNLNYGASFSSDAINNLVSPTTVAGIRVDIGINEENKWTLILRAVDSNGNIELNAVILDKAKMCPPDCGSNNILNF